MLPPTVAGRDLDRSGLLQISGAEEVDRSSSLGIGLETSALPPAAAGRDVDRSGVGAEASGGVRHS